MIFKGTKRPQRKYRAAAVGLGALCLAIAGIAAPAAAAEEKASAPAMWELKDEDSTLFLFGTFHLLPKGTEWQTAAFDKAMKSTQTTMIEADVTSPEAQAAIGQLVQQHGLNPEGVTLSGTLGEERAAQFAAVAEKFGVPMAALEKARPWLALLTVAQAAYVKSGFDPSKGVEMVVLARAVEEGDTVGYLESAETQIKALASLDESEMLNNLEVTLEQFDDFEAYTKGMVEAWRSGNLKKMDTLYLADFRKEAPGAYEVLIVKRNRDWAAQIKDIMEGEGTHFIAVGAAHLAGKDSVVRMLGDAGLKPKRIQ